MFLGCIKGTTVALSKVLYPGHIPTDPIQKMLLGIGAGLISITDPRRHGLIDDLFQQLQSSSLV